MPVDPGPCRWGFPPVDGADDSGLLAVGADLEPSTMLAAYCAGVFPMPLSRRGRLGWWSPDPRGVIPPAAVHQSRSMARTRKRFTITVDQDFDGVVAACADPRRPHGWITPTMRRAYSRLHVMGWAHSVEAWQDGELAGGLFGIAVGGLFAGESMFHHRTDGSKAALLGLCDLLAVDGEDRLLDVQWTTDHLRTLGAVDVPRADYLAMLGRALELGFPPAFAGP